VSLKKKTQQRPSLNQLQSNLSAMHLTQGQGQGQGQGQQH
jgi:hypothetical protein